MRYAARRHPCTNLRGKVSVTDLASTVDIVHANAAQNQLAITVLAGNDVIEGSGLAADAIGLHAEGGGEGADGPDGGPGSNLVIQ